MNVPTRIVVIDSHPIFRQGIIRTIARADSMQVVAEGTSAVLAAFSGTDAVGVELSAVGYIDSSGVAALVEGLQHARAHGRRFALVAPSDAVRAVLELARLDRVFAIVADTDALLAPT